MYKSKAFRVTADGVSQGDFEAKAISSTQLISGYRSSYKVPTKREIVFKFSINGEDNERYPGEDHHAILSPSGGKAVSAVYQFGEPDPAETGIMDEKGSLNLEDDMDYTFRVDMRKVLADLESRGYYITKTGQKIEKNGFQGVFIAGSTLPLSWDFPTLAKKQQFRLQDPDGDGVYQVTIHFRKFQEAAQDSGGLRTWKLTQDLSKLPRYHSRQPLVDALYNKSLEEMLLDIRDDGAFMAGAKWPGVWTRDISYSILLSLAAIQPEAAKRSLIAKVKNNRIIQDTGTGGSWPVSTDRMTWALAAWEVYTVTGDTAWLRSAYQIIKNSAEDDLQTAFNRETGLFHGESSFLDWREQTYPRWMDPKDIFVSQNLGTNAVHYQTYRILARMAEILGEDGAAFRETAETVKNAINRSLCMPEKGYYGQYLYGRNYLSLSPRSETLGEALCILFNIADSARRQQIFRNMPVTAFGPTCIFPQIPNIPPYHNDAIWPFVVSYWTWAAARTGNPRAVELGLASIYRAATLFLTNKENMVASTGDYMGTEINSDRQLWSVAGNLATIYRVFLGMNFQPDKLVFTPFIPAAYKGTKTLQNFVYRKATLNITINGTGNIIRDVSLDGKTLKEAALPGDISGDHELVITMAGNRPSGPDIHMVKNAFAPETPQVKLTEGQLAWDKIEDAVSYRIFKNGKMLGETQDFVYPVPEDGSLAEYQVAAVDAGGWQSFLSEPVVTAPPENVLTVRAKGKLPVKMTTKQNRKVGFSVTVPRTGDYSIDFHYANGNGPINTNNRCAIRTFFLDDARIAAVVFPQRGNNEWEDWGFSNAVQVRLTKGRHHFSLRFAPTDNNMNGVVNEAWLDYMRIRLLK
ncbi:MAG: glycogen debranching protein [Calditrichia bacterium]